MSGARPEQRGSGLQQLLPGDFPKPDGTRMVIPNSERYHSAVEFTKSAIARLQGRRPAHLRDSYGPRIGIDMRVRDDGSAEILTVAAQNPADVMGKYHRLLQWAWYTQTLVERAYGLGGALAPLNGGPHAVNTAIDGRMDEVTEAIFLPEKIPAF